MIFQRILKYGMSGSDVRYIKNQLFAAGYYAASITSIQNNVFGADTRAAVRIFQQNNLDANGKRLTVDGTIGQKTWDAIERTSSVEQNAAIPKNIGTMAAVAITPALVRVSKERSELVLQALSFAFDPEVPENFPRSLYIRGGNLYNSDLKLNIITAPLIESGAKKQPEYYNGGRAEMMKAAVRADPSISGADCSGGIVGLLRKYGVVKPTFDTTADTLTGSFYSQAIQQEALQSGDWVGKSGHIGLYAGGGYAVEWMGGAYGCQLSKLADRRGYDFVAGKMKKQSSWTKYRKPNLY
ncbi:MAG: peptidoglycan-binding domain-containing protein [Clostridia bacterium]